jgi:hypothetical protein
MGTGIFRPLRRAFPVSWLQTVVQEEKHSLTNPTALQRLPLRLQRDRRPIRPHSLAPHPDEPREQGGIRNHFT